MLTKTTNGITTKYVYGNGLIGEEKQNCFKTYHFDYRGSTVAITNASGNITDTFEYDTYDNYVTASIELNFSTALRNKPPAFNPVRDPVYCYDPLLEKAPSAAKKDNPSHSTPTKDWSLPGFWDPVPSGAPSMDLSLEQAASFLLLAGLGGILLRKAYTGP